MKRHLLRRLAALLLCLLLLVPVQVFAEDETATVAVDGVVLRAGPAASYGTVKLNGNDVTLNRGDVVELWSDATPDENGCSVSWYMVCATVTGNNAVGFLRADQLSFSGGDPVPQGVAALSLKGDAAANVGDTVTLTISLSATDAIGSWLFELYYDDSVLRYESGADNASDGRLLFCNWSDGVTAVNMTLVFTAVGEGTASLTVSSPQIVAFDNVSEMEANDLSFTVTVTSLCEHTAWSAVTYSWSENNLECTASRTCLSCGFTETESATVDDVSIVAATCESPETSTYTVSFFYEIFERQTKTAVTGPALGHDYASDVTAPTCTAGGYTAYTCSRCGHSYVGDETAALGHDYAAVVTAPTCTDGGYTTYTCSRCGHSYVGDETAALGHDWSEASYSWSPDLSTCTGTRVCACCGARETETAAVTVTVTKPAAYWTPGENTLTAEFENPSFTAQTQTVETEGLILWGDANGDGKISNSDVVRLKNYLANYDEETGVSTNGTATYELSPGADANGDGKISNSDVVRLKNYLANYDEESGLSTVALGPAS